MNDSKTAWQQNIEKQLEHLKQDNEMIIEFFRRLLRGNYSEPSKKKSTKKLKKLNQQALAKIETLEKNLASVQAQKTELEQNLRDLQTENQNLSRQNDLLKAETQKMLVRIGELEAQLEAKPLSQLKSLYLSLDELTQNDLKRIFKFPEELSLFAAGILHLDALWDYASDLRRQHKDQLFPIIRNMIELLFEFYAPLANAEWQAVAVGEEFDREVHQKDNRSSVAGKKISQVILKGYSRNNRLIKQSIVEVENE